MRMMGGLGGRRHAGARGAFEAGGQFEPRCRGRKEVGKSEELKASKA